MSSQTLVPFAYIPENSQATPGLWNSVFSTLSQNIALVNSNATLTPPSGNTLTVGSDLSVLGTIAVSGPVRVGLNSNVTNYLFLSDTSNARSNYVIGSQVGGTADGLNIWDDSGSTMIVSFSKQSVRFYQNVIGSAFDLGGAQFNVKGFGAAGDGVTDDTNAFLAALSNISQIGSGVLLVPSSQSPYKITSTLTVSPNVTLVGGGGYNPTLAYSGPANAPCISFLGTSEAQGCNVTIQNLTLQSTSIYQRIGIRLRNFSNFYLRNVDLSQWSTALWADWGQGIYADYCNVSTNRFGLLLGGQGPAGGIRGGSTATFDFMDFCFIRGCQFSSNSVDIEHKGTHNSDGQFSVVETTFAELPQSAQSVTGKIHFVHVAGMKSASFLNNLWELPWPRAALTFDTVDADGTSQGSVIGGAIIGNWFHLNGGSGTTGVWLKAAQQISSFANTFEATGAASAHDIEDPTGTNSVGFSAYSGSALIPVSSMSWRQLSVGSFMATERSTTTGPVEQANNTKLVRLYGGPNARIQIFPLDSTASAWEIDNLSGTLRIYNDSFINVSITSRQFAVADGIAKGPSLAFTSEKSLGWYRSGASTMVQSYGTLVEDIVSLNSIVPNSLVSISLATTTFAGAVEFLTAGAVDSANGTNKIRIYGGASSQLQLFPNGATGAPFQLDQFNSQIRIVQSGSVGQSITSRQIWMGNDGSASVPGYTWSGETALGLYRSASSTVALSRGTFDLTAAVLSIASLKVKSGTNNSCGTAVLGSNGSVNVANTYVAAGDLIFLTDQTPGGTLGDLELGGIRAGSGFTIQSTSITDSSTVGWLIIRPT